MVRRRTIGVRVAEPVRRRLQRMAEANGVTIPEVVRQILGRETRRLESQRGDEPSERD